MLLAREPPVILPALLPRIGALRLGTALINRGGRDTQRYRVGAQPIVTAIAATQTIKSIVQAPCLNVWTAAPRGDSLSIASAIVSTTTATKKPAQKVRILSPVTSFPVPPR